MDQDNPYQQGRWLVVRRSFTDSTCPLAKIFKGEVYQIHSWAIIDGAPGVFLEGLTKTRAFPIHLFAPLKVSLTPKLWVKS